MSPFVVVVLVLVAVLNCGLVLEVWHIVRRDPPAPDDGADAADGVSGAAAPEARSERTPSLAILRASAANQVAPSPSPPPSPAARTPQPEHERANRGSDPRPPHPGRRFKNRRGAPAGSPPDAAREWTAEIAWRNADGGSRFVVCARPGDGPEVVILSSGAVEWPPRGDDGVAGLEQVVRGLKAQLLGAGWTAADAGEAWYAERFAWAPRDAVPDPVATSSSRAGAAARRVAPDRPEVSSG